MLYVVSVDYNDDLNCIVLKLYNSETEKLEYFYDYDFKSYFVSAMPVDGKGIVKQEPITKYNALHDRLDKLVKVYTETPYVIASMNRQIKDDEKKLIENPLKDNVWENHIKFFQSYIYDNDIKIGMPSYRGEQNL